MLKFAIAALSGALTSFAAQAASIDFTDEVFSDVVYLEFPSDSTGNGTGPIVSFKEVVDGITFTLTAQSGEFRGVGTWGNGFSNEDGPYALSLGGGGLETTLFTMSTSHDVTFQNFFGFAQEGNTAPVFDITGSGTSSVGNAFGTEGFLDIDTPASNSFVGGPISLGAGDTLTFSVTNASLSTTGHITSLTFAPAAIPLPLSAWLLVSGLGMVTVVRLRR